VKYLKILLFYLLIFLVESAVISALLTAITLLYLKPTLEISVGFSLLAQTALYMYFKCIVELPLSMLIIVGATYKLNTTTKDIIVSRAFSAVIAFSALVALAIDESRGIDAFSLYPVLYLAAIFITYAVFKKRLGTIIGWVENRA